MGELGSIENDRDDVIFMLLQEHEELEFLKEWLKEKKIKAPDFKPKQEEEEE